MKTRKALALITGAAMALSLLAGCGSGSGSSASGGGSASTPDASTGGSGSAAGEEIVIGCTLQNLSEEFMTMLKGAMELKVAEYDNVRLIVNDAESMSDKQASQLDSFITQGVDAVIISPVDADALAPAVKSVVDAGIPRYHLLRRRYRRPGPGVGWLRERKRRRGSGPLCGRAAGRRGQGCRSPRPSGRLRGAGPVCRL